MWIILYHPDMPITTVMSRQDLNFPSFIIRGYKSIFEGTRFECESKQEELTARLVSGMGMSFWGPGL